MRRILEGIRHSSTYKAILANCNCNRNRCTGLQTGKPRGSFLVLFCVGLYFQAIMSKMKSLNRMKKDRAMIFQAQNCCLTHACSDGRHLDHLQLPGGLRHAVPGGSRCRCEHPTRRRDGLDVEGEPQRGGAWQVSSPNPCLSPGVVHPITARLRSQPASHFKAYTRKVGEH